MSHLPGSPSPEARAALAAYEDAAHDLAGKLRECSSGKQLAAKGFEHDVSLSAELDVLDCAPILQDGAYVMWRRT